MPRSVADVTATQAVVARVIRGPDRTAGIKPVLRGWMHLVCFFLAIPAGVVIVAMASSPRARIAAVAYAVALIALFGVSGAYHRGPWSPEWRLRMQRLDHATIFVMIAGSYTPMCLLVLDSWIAVSLLVAAWSGAVVGGVLACRSDRVSWFCRNALYIVLGWFAVVAIPQLVNRLSAVELTLVGVGGLLFSLGALGLATRWPDPFPRIFGYHEVWHTLVVAAVVCQFVAIASIIHAHTPA
jgi:hemolysin III